MGGESSTERRQRQEIQKLKLKAELQERKAKNQEWERRNESQQRQRNYKLQLATQKKQMESQYKRQLQQERKKNNLVEIAMAGANRAELRIAREYDDMYNCHVVHMDRQQNGRPKVNMQYYEKPKLRSSSVRNYNY